jgi:hypothetical protein
MLPFGTIVHLARGHCMRFCLGALLLASFVGQVSAAEPIDSEWVRRFGGRDHEWIYTLAPDGAGGVFYGGAAGQYLGDAIVGRFDANGELAWSSRFDFPLPGQSPFGGYPTTHVVELQNDPADNLYVLGYGDPELINRAFVGKFDQSGTLKWISQTELNADYLQLEHATKMAVDGSGNVFIAGAALHADTTTSERFISMFNTDGQLQWSSRNLPPQFGDFLRITPDDNGGALLYGVRNDASDRALTLAMVDATGRAELLRETELVVGINAEMVAIESGNMYVFNTEGTFQLPIYTVSKVDQMGQVVWTSEPLPLERHSVLSIAVDNFGQVFAAGSLRDKTTVAMLSRDGDILGSHSIAAAREDNYVTIHVDSLGNLFLGGNLYYIDYSVDDDVRDALITKLSVSVPEPSSIALASLGVVGLLINRFRRRKFRQQ